MKLTDLKLVAHVGDHPSLYRRKKPDGDWDYFPHVHIGVDECAHPRYYMPAGSDPAWTGRPFDVSALSLVRGNTLTVNEAGDYNAGKAIFNGLAELLAAGPAMLRALQRVADGGILTGDERQMVAHLLLYDVRPSSVAGRGTYFNADGTPYEEST